MAASRIASNSRLCFRYKFYFYIFILILVVQLLLVYNFYSMNQKELDNLQGPHLSPGSPIESDGRPNVHTRNVVENEKGPPHRGGVSQPKFVFNSPDSFTPKCEIKTKDTWSALNRSNTVLCKQQISNVACLDKEGKLYPKSLPRYCPYKGNDTGMYLGCFRDSRAKRELGGHHKDFPDTNSPSVCIAHCLQAGFQYAGVQYTKECWCGDEYGKYGLLPETQCATPCPHNSTHTCGGFLAMRIFSTGLGEKKKMQATLVKSSEVLSGDRVRIAFVFTLNGRAVRQVYRLLKTLYHTNHYYFFHIDARQEYLQREMQNLARRFPNMYVTHKRLPTIWGGASLLQAHLNIMTELLAKSQWQWDYYVNLSESDYPIKKLEELVSFLTKYKTYNFLKTHGRDTPRFIQKQGLDQTFFECENHLWRVGPRNIPEGIRVDGGSDWIGIHRNFCDYIINSKDDLVSGLKRVYEYTLLPAESFFHTVLQNSRFCGMFVDNNLRITNWRRKLGCKCQYKHIVDWCGCSPNVFKSADLHRLMNMDEKPIFFARKFEPVVNQDIINSVDTYLFGYNNQGQPGFNSYWQNEYHHLDKNTKVDDAYLTFFHSFIRLSMRHLTDTNRRCRLRFIELLEVTMFFEADHFHGLLVKFSAEQMSSGRVYKMETQLHPKSSFYIMYNTGLSMSRLQGLEVSTDFDPKELIFRNYGQLMGPYSNIALRHSWANGDEVAVSAAWIDPSNTIAASFDMKIPSGAHIAAHKPPFRKPLRPGVWTIKMFHEWETFAEVKFLILPLSFYQSRPILASEIYATHNGPKGRYLDLDNKIDFSDFRKPLKIENITEAETRAVINGRKVGKDLDKWIDSLTEEFWQLQNFCTHKELVPFCGVPERCEHSTWSSMAADTKSTITVVDENTGHLR
ncbi:xylosyltransferase 2-like [Argonauta hians]